jgi:hypothetical protein
MAAYCAGRHRFKGYRPLVAHEEVATVERSLGVVVRLIHNARLVGAVIVADGHAALGVRLKEGELERQRARQEQVVRIEELDVRRAAIEASASGR